MKNIFTVFLIFLFMNLGAQGGSNNLMHDDWITYVGSYDFSSSFRSEMSKQLKDKLYNINNLDRKVENPVKLIIGLLPIDRGISDGYVFITVNVLIVGTEQLFPVSICWTSKDFSNLEKIQNTDLSDKKIEFEWCKDFPFDELKKAISTEKVFSEVNNLKYIIIAKYYPDVIVKFNLKNILDLKESKIIENIFKKNRNVYVSEFTENMIMLDFQLDIMNFKEKDFTKDMDYLESSIRMISELSFANKIESLEIK
ncbi:hypothetical protein [Chryseobacterium caseinilyticum]|uniref:DUF4468 domain-containing protein n=1 Tax=Chryseobacterium caseinilyticum TaxID=2771428 RepID=A0ABR8Z9Q8_9FLAO|nr:hypothetical protein [Chryseobacterium caseinilyticum]MBD8082022.1 hypothetical protein [Chryseobacterium caseinilyticum]